MEDMKSTLEKEYCPPIDSALFHAILLDFKIDSHEGLQDARNTLDAIKANAEFEEATGFDPSGSSSLATGPDTSDQSGSQNNGSNSKTTETCMTGTSSSTKSLGLDSHIDDLAFDDKLSLLCETFPDIAAFTITATLRKCCEDFEKTIDELLTASFLADGEDSEGEHYHIPKGVEGFAQSSSHAPRTKSKKKKHKITPETLLSANSYPLSDRTLNVPSKWDRANQEIDYLAYRINISRSSIASYYHSSSASLKKTILALAKDPPLIETLPPDNLVQSEATTLAIEFPDISQPELTGIVRMTHPSSAAAHEIAKATLKNPFPAFESKHAMRIQPKYARIALDEQKESDSSSGTRFRIMKRTDTTNAATLASAYYDARQEALAKASAAYRKSRSNPLMGGAASYYGEVGRDARALADMYSATAADQLVARQSTSTSIDLHGVDVKNAVRIALEKVELWWAQYAAEWAREGKVVGGGGFSIITGSGKHSQGGKARIGPAVRKALAASGWRIEDNGGVVLVRGKVRN